MAGAGVDVLTSRVLDRLHGGSGTAGDFHLEPRFQVAPGGMPYLGFRVPVGT